MTILIRLGVLAVFLPLAANETARAAQHGAGSRSSIELVSYRIEGRQVIFTSADGRVFSLALGTPGAEELMERIDRAGRSSLAGDVLSVQDVLELLRAGISEETVIEHVRASGARFALTKDDLLALKQAGASEPFLRFLIATGSGWRVIGPVRTASARDEPPSAAPEAAEPAPAGIPIYPYVYPGYPYFGFPVFSTVILPPAFGGHRVKKGCCLDGALQAPRELRSLVGTRAPSLSRPAARTGRRDVGAAGRNGRGSSFFVNTRGAPRSTPRSSRGH